MTEPAGKPALRAQLRTTRDAFVLALAPGERARLETQAAQTLAPLLDGARCVAFYVAFGSEIGCAPAIAAAADRRIVIALPHVDPDGGAMRFAAWSPGAPLDTGWRGLRQPAASSQDVEPDVIIVPMLGFDSGLMRIGQGGGFYDRALAARPSAKKIGFAWGVQQLPAIPADPWDQRLDRIVTEAGIVAGSAPS